MRDVLHIDGDMVGLCVGGLHVESDARDFAAGRCAELSGGIDLLYKGVFVQRVVRGRVVVVALMPDGHVVSPGHMEGDGLGNIEIAIQVLRFDQFGAVVNIDGRIVGKMVVVVSSDVDFHEVVVTFLVENIGVENVCRSVGHIFPMT